jgi:DNA-binding transcriptional LysR family regulator
VREGSFTDAAAKLGVSQSALSHTLRRLEAALGIRLLSRTTRSLAPTEAGQRLLERLGPHFEQIETELEGLAVLRQTPAGTVRITASEHAAHEVLWPALRKFLSRYPQIRVEVSVDQSFTDIVAERFDAGVRFGEQIEKDMSAVRIGPDVGMLVVGAPAYFAARTAPHGPQELTGHNCINMRLPTRGGLYAWELEKSQRKLNVRVDGQLVLDNIALMLEAALDGVGLAFLPEGIVRPYLAQGRLRSVLEEWCPPFAGYHLYYPSRRQVSPAFALLVDALRYTETAARGLA